MSANPQTDLGIAGIDDIKPLDEHRSPVFSARQSIIGRTVAVKILNPHNDPLLPRRFDRRRKDFVKYTSSPQVIPLYDSGETKTGKPYIMMPYFKIGSLQDQINHGKMPWHLAARIVQRATESVAIAHASNFALGDIKPSSILLSDPETPRIAVYGMATRRFDDGGPSFIAPEVDIDTEPLPASDVYSLAMTLGALITGEAPSRSTPREKYLENIEPLVPPRIFEVIEHGTSTALSNRYGSAKHLANVLTGAVAAETKTPTRTKLSTLTAEPSSIPKSVSSDTDEPAVENGPITVDELLGPVQPNSEEIEETSKQHQTTSSKTGKSAPFNGQAKSPKPSDNDTDNLIHLGPNGFSAAASQFKTTTEIVNANEDLGQLMNHSEHSNDEVEGESEVSQAQGSGTKISISEEPTESPNPPFPLLNPSNDQTSATEQIEITSLDVPFKTTSEPEETARNSDSFRQTRVFSSSSYLTEGLNTDSLSENLRPHQNFGPTPGATNARQGGAYDHPVGSRIQSRHTGPDNLWLSIQDSWQSNRGWFSIALAGVALITISLIVLVGIRGGDDSSGTGADLPPLTTEPDDTSSPEFNPPPVIDLSDDDELESESEPQTPSEDRAVTQNTARRQESSSNDGSESESPTTTVTTTTAEPSTTVEESTTTTPSPTTTPTPTLPPSTSPPPSPPPAPAPAPVLPDDPEVLPSQFQSQ